MTLLYIIFYFFLLIKIGLNRIGLNRGGGRIIANTDPNGRFRQCCREHQIVYENGNALKACNYPPKTAFGGPQTDVFRVVYRHFPEFIECFTNKQDNTERCVRNGLNRNSRCMVRLTI